MRDYAAGKGRKKSTREFCFRSVVIDGVDPDVDGGWIEKEKKVALLREARKDLRRTEREREREDEEEWTERQRRKTRQEGEGNGGRVWDRLREKKEWFCRRE